MMKLRKLTLAVATAAIAASAQQYTPRHGDLLFQIAGESAMSAAITDATTTAADTLRFDHVGVLSIGAGGVPAVIDASPGRGVGVKSLSHFVGESRGVVVMRVAGHIDVDATVARVLTRIGEPYDWCYLPDNGMTYCSELVADCYLETDDTPVFPSRPMTFKGPDGTVPEFWLNLFEGLGMEVPEGVPGTNPTDLSRSPRLKRVGYLAPKL